MNENNHLSPSMNTALERRATIPSTPPDPGVLDSLLQTELEASASPKVHCLARYKVRLMVSYRTNKHLVHTRFRDLGTFLYLSDLLIVNTSGTLNAALPAMRTHGTAVELHFSTHLPANLWTVEVRPPRGMATVPFYGAKVNETLTLRVGASATLHRPYAYDLGRIHCAGTRQWIATLHLPGPLQEYLTQHGFPIRCGYTKHGWPSSYCQTSYATEPGSAEMSSVGRALTLKLITRLVSHGMQIAPLILRTGVASLEEYKAPYEEFYRVPPDTARAVNSVWAAGKRVVVGGMTVVRVLETAADGGGITYPGEGRISLPIIQHWGIRALNALLSGFHEPCSRHLGYTRSACWTRTSSVYLHRRAASGLAVAQIGDLNLIPP